MTSSEEFDEMKESARKCQFEQSWAECRRRLYREQEFKLKKSPSWIFHG